jgi:hypothetical protein
VSSSSTLAGAVTTWTRSQRLVRGVLKWKEKRDRLIPFKEASWACAADFAMLMLDAISLLLLICVCDYSCLLFVD